MTNVWYDEIIAKNDPGFQSRVESMRDFVMQEGAIPAKYKVLMTMVIDSLLAHDTGVGRIAGRARALGATEAEIAEAVRIAFLYGGTPALVSALNAYPTGIDVER